MHHTEHDWLELWKSLWIIIKCMLYWLIIMYDHDTCYCFSFWLWLFDNCWFLFDNCVWAWWLRTVVRGSRWTAIAYLKWDSFVEVAKPTWWHWDYFGRELCFVNQLLPSRFYDSIWIENVNNRFNYMYELIYFPSCEWCVLS